MQIIEQKIRGVFLIKPRLFKDKRGIFRRSFCSSTLENQKIEIQGLQKDIMSEANSRGYDTRILRKLIAIRKKDPHVVSDENAVLELYKDVLSM